MNTTRASLIQRVKNGNDDSAWRRFYELYSSLVYSYARNKGLNDTDASEVESECMAALAQRIKEFQYNPARCKFRNWLRTIASNKIVDVLRNRNKHQADTLDLAAYADNANVVDEQWDQQWRINLMLHCLKKLEKEVPPNHAQAFRLNVIEQLPAKQVADRLGMSVENVYQVKVRLTRKLRQSIEESINCELT